MTDFSEYGAKLRQSIEEAMGQMEESRQFSLLSGRDDDPVGVFERIFLS